ncbi:homocysteine S-methyltransferase [Streptococcus moroccensis]|uniref:Homocysteine S-methyltransferase n=1 Tax=Streptococcus moroccensis TaxID=1451356 RepID=A0ABT9YTG6_9STRE|nr:homocysteine S-methyltransferase [Streptococcus moroccensis]MDQ0222907.1 homocysteine S-methyltransferase [Streptococcus moroccensis]
MGRLKEQLETKPVLILDGALGTELEYRSYDVSGNLWSAKYLIEKPEAIQDLHETYMEAGADILTTSTYQATFPGLIEAGLSKTDAEKVLRLTVALAKTAREKVWSSLLEEEKAKRSYPLIGGDIGPYAAYLADGSEYSGDYGEITVEALKAFHRPRIAILLEEGVDFLILETVPNGREAQALVELLSEEFSTVEAYLSVTSPNGASLPDGTPIEQIGSLVEMSNQVLAVGINCSAPKVVTEALSVLSRSTSKPLVTYPNSGEIYDGATQTWSEDADHSHSLLENTQAWQTQGAKIVGGCCRTRPSDIADLSQGLRG